MSENNLTADGRNCYNERAPKMTSFDMENSFNADTWLMDCAKRADSIGVEVSRFQDFDQQAEQLIGFGQEYHQLSLGSFEGRFLNVDFGGGISIHIEYANQALAQSMTAPSDCVAIGVVLGSLPYRVNGQPLDLNSVLLVPPGAELKFRSPKGGSIIALCISTEFLAASDIGRGVPFLSAGQAATVLAAPDFSARARIDIIDAVNKAASMTEFAILGRILATSLLANLGAEIALRSDGPSRLIQNRKLDNFRRTVAMFNTHQNVPISYDILTKRLGLSRRNLQKSFNDVVGCGPFEYLRILRLCDARSRFALHSASEQTIGDIAAEVGFFDWSHFSRIYKKQFGESPSQTRMRSSLNVQRT